MLEIEVVKEVEVDMPYFFCLILGSPNFQNYPLMCKKLDSILPDQNNIVIVSDGEEGAGDLAVMYAKSHDYKYKVFQAEKDLLGKNAENIRNEDMQSYIATKKYRGCVTFYEMNADKKKEALKIAEKYKNPIRNCRI